MLKLILVTLVLASVSFRIQAMSEPSNGLLKPKILEEVKYDSSLTGVNPNLVNQILKVNILAIGAQGEQPAIDLGYVIDITDMSGNNFTSSCFSPDLLKNPDYKKTEPTPASSSYKQVISDTDESMLEVSGSLEMKMSIEVASVTGKAQIKSHSTSKKATRTAVVKQVIEEYTDSLDIQRIKEDDLLCGKNVKFTHVVAKVIRGKRFSGTVTMESQISDNSLEAQGRLRVYLMEIPIGGEGEVDYHSDDIRKNYNFEAELKTTGGNFVKSVNDVAEYVQQADHWLKKAHDQEDKDIKTMPVSYELHPISTLKNFGDRKVERTKEEEMLLARAIPIINDMTILQEAVQYLKLVAPSSEIDNLNKRTDTLEDKTIMLSNAGLKNKITQEMIKDMRKERLSTFLESAYYKELLKKIQAEKDTIRTGQFYLKFDNKYLTPKRALHIEISNKDVTADGKDNGICSLNDNKGRTEYRGFGQETKFICWMDYVTNDTAFYDKYITFPKDSCKRVENFVQDDFDNVSIHYETKGDQAKIHFENKFTAGSGVTLDCNGYHTVKPECKETDLPLFHIKDINSALIEDMKYHLIATEEKSYDQDHRWNVEKVAESDEHFHITNQAKEGRKLCMYDFNGYYSVVIDKAPEDHSVCHWRQKDGILFNVYHNKCISRAGNLPSIPLENSIQLAGYYNNGNDKCVSFVQELPISLANQRMLRRSVITATE